MRAKSKQIGFTIVELLIVIVVIGILAAIVIVAYSGIQNRAKVAAIQSDLKNAAQQLDIYRVGIGTSDTYPASLDCTTSPAVNSICLKNSPGTSYQYTYISSSNDFCLTAINGSNAYNYASSTQQITSGVCAGDVGPNVVILAGITTSLAGNSSQGFVNGNGSSANFSQPNDISVDSSGNVYVADLYNATIRKITSSGDVTTFGSGISYPESVVNDAAGNVYVASYGANAIYKITPGGVTSILAGGSAGSANGTGAAAQFGAPRGITIDSSGNLFVADTNNQLIRKVTPGGVVTTFAGSGASASTDGTGTAAAFTSPYAIDINSSGSLFVAEYDSGKIRKITSSGVVTTLAGSTSGYADGTGAAAQFDHPTGIGVDPSGNVYVGDSNNNRIRKVTPAGVVTTFLGSGVAAFANGTGTAAAFNYPAGITFDTNGIMYIADRNNNRIRKVE